MSQSPSAVVTGSSRGIGRGISIELAKSGYDIIVNYAGNQQAALDTKAKIEEIGQKAEIIQANVGNEEDRKRLIDTSTELFGKIDLLVNNAGIAPKVRADLLEMSMESYQHVMETNLTGPFFLTQYTANKMIEFRQKNLIEVGRIVFVTSISAFTSSINRGEYCLSKAGLSMATKLFADRLAKENIFVYEIQPGIIQTDMTSVVKDKYDKLFADGAIAPQCRWGTPEDIGKTVRAIAEGLLDYSTGSSIEVGGGFGIKRL